MSGKTDTQVRSLICQILYKKRRESTRDRTVNRKTMSKSLNVQDPLMDYHMDYLAEKELIKIYTAPNSDWISAEITADGIDHVDAGRCNEE